MRDRHHIIIGFIKLGLYLAMAATFFLFLAIRNPEILTLSREAVLTWIFYVIISGMLLAIYGGYDIGKKSRRAVENSIFVNSWLTDLLMFLQICALFLHEMDTERFLGSVGMLFFAMALQGCEILAFIHLSYRVYHYATSDVHTLFVINRAQDQEKLLAGIERAAAAREGDRIIEYTDEHLYETVDCYDNIFISEIPVESRKELIEYAFGRNKNILFTPEINDIVEYSCEYRMFDDTLVLSAPKKELGITERVVKRAMDIVGSLILLIVSLPIYVAVAIAIKLDDGGRIFFSQTRATKDGKPFRIYKFRTMKENEITMPMLENDDRVTRVGRFLRKTRIDEIPQFINVLKGEMSLVGPRPEQMEYLHGFDKNYPEYEYRLRVKAGMTGFAQIEGKYNTTNKEKLILDLMYIQNYSLWLDLKLILQTLLVMLKEDSTEGF